MDFRDSNTKPEMEKTSLITKICSMSLPAKIIFVSCAVLILAAAGTGVFLLADPLKPNAAPTVSLQVSSVASSKPAVTALSLSQTSVTLETGKTAQINATPEPVSTDEKIVWTSSDKKVATVSSDGLVTAVAKGTCTVTASVGSSVNASVQITVKDPGDEEIDLLKGYLKNGLQVPSLPANGIGQIDDAKASVKALDDAAIVDLNGDNHYEMVVEHLFQYSCNTMRTQYLPFFEIYYVKGGQVIKSPMDLGKKNWESAMGAGFGTSTEYIFYYIAKDTETGSYYFIKNTNDSAEAANGLEGPVSFTANILDGAKVTPIMKLYSGLGSDSGVSELKNQEGFIYALDGNQVNKSGFTEAEKQLKPVCFDVAFNRNPGKAEISANSGFRSDKIPVFKNSRLPSSSLSGVVKKDQEKAISDPLSLIGMPLSEAKNLYGDYSHSDYAALESQCDQIYDFDNFPYTIGCTSDSIISVIYIHRNGTKFFKNAKVGIDSNQLMQVFGENSGTLKLDFAPINKGEGSIQTKKGKFEFEFYLSEVKSNTICTQVAITKADT